MASGTAHHATGWAAGVIAAAIVTHLHADGPWHLYAALAFIGGVAGGSAPDWLEVAWWSRKRRLWITHRTLTHWGIGWIALLAWSYHRLGHLPVATLTFGFACGGVMHLLADWPNPLGVPWVIQRHSLNWWKSGRCDLIVVAASWVAAWFFALHGMPHGWPLAPLRSLISRHVAPEFDGSIRAQRQHCTAQTPVGIGTLRSAHYCSVTRGNNLHRTNTRHNRFARWACSSGVA